MAGGFVLKKEKIDEFRSFLIKNFNRNKYYDNEIKNIYLDSSIAPTALNVDFYNEINSLGPFGSGNIEPKFVIENLKLISSHIVGENHIKSILQGNDGTVIKSFAWNCVNGPLEPFLSKTNKKKFHIAGKMRKNEWKGKKDIEFIIEDISQN